MHTGRPHKADRLGQASTQLASSNTPLQCVLGHTEVAVRFGIGSQATALEGLKFSYPPRDSPVQRRDAHRAIC